MLRFKFFIVIVTPDDCDKAREIICGHGARGVAAVPGKGCAKHEILEELGFKDDKKQVLTGFVPEDNENALLDALYSGLLYKKGAGLAFTVNVQECIGLRSVFLTS